MKKSAVNRYFAAALAAGGAVAAWAGPAFASGLPMATEWTLARDGGRIINSVVVLGAVVYLVIRFGGPVLRRRADLIAQRISELNEARRRAEQSLAEYEKRLEKIAAEGEKLKAEARAEGEMVREKTLKQAREDAERIVEKAREQIVIETEKAKADLRRETAIEAINLAEELLRKNISADDQKRLMQEYISSVEKRN